MIYGIILPIGELIFFKRVKTTNEFTFIDKVGVNRQVQTSGNSAVEG